LEGKKMKKVFGVILVTVLALSMATGVVTAAPSGFVNPSFEGGNLFGWGVTVPPGGYAAAVSTYGGYTPASPGGNYFAVLKTDGPGSYTIISQTFSIQAGDTITGWSFFKANDTMPNNDNAQVRILQGTAVIATVFGGSVSATGTRPWTLWQYTFAISGTYTLEARIANGGNALNDSFMGLDAIAFKVEIDIKPGSYPNSINLNSKGVVPVAVLTTPIFDATTLDTDTVRFAGASPIHQNLDDVDGDGDMDYLFHFRIQDLFIVEGQEYARLQAHTTTPNYLIWGEDTLNIVPPDN
jgi:hypothetical protein